uniref:Uncharacterized protein n=1 Tax=Thermogemmatispora argillosa TaxID=2045280 RepID=A0A455T3Y5_9CHLR|nr:hypothetical protein KTA_27290 [Thermogemmatispora argillosa]
MPGRVEKGERKKEPACESLANGVYSSQQQRSMICLLYCPEAADAESWSQPGSRQTDGETNERAR